MKDSDLIWEAYIKEDIDTIPPAITDTAISGEYQGEDDDQEIRKMHIFWLQRYQWLAIEGRKQWPGIPAVLIGNIPLLDNYNDERQRSRDEWKAWEEKLKAIEGR